MSYLHLLYTAILTLMVSSHPAPEEARPATQKLSFSADNNNKIETMEIIPWSPSRRLAWDDFLGTPQRNTDAVASTSTTLGLSYRVEDGELLYNITCDFSKMKSWGSLKTDYILSHEQGHFDITEIHARLLYQAMQQYVFNRRTYKQDINNIYQSVVKSKEAMQAAYDGESDHSRRYKRQFEWEEKIGDLLTETEGLASYP